MDFRRLLAALILVAGSAAIVSSGENPFTITPSRENPFKIERRFVIVQTVETVQTVSRPMYYPTRLLVFKSRACGPCREYESGALETLVKRGKGWSKGPSDAYPIQIIDVDKQPNLAVAYGVTQWPTTIALVQGKERRRRVGVIYNPQDVFDLLKEDAPSTVTVVQTKSYPWRGRYLNAEYRNRDRMARHLIEEHGYPQDAVMGLPYESLRQLHDQAHGEDIP